MYRGRGGGGRGAPMILVIFCSLISCSLPQSTSLSQLLQRSSSSLHRHIPSSLLTHTLTTPWELLRDHNDDRDDAADNLNLRRTTRFSSTSPSSVPSSFMPSSSSLSSSQSSSSSSLPSSTWWSTRSSSDMLRENRKNLHKDIAQDLGLWRDQTTQQHPDPDMVQRIVSAMLTRQQASKRKRPSSLMGLDNLDFAASTLDRARFDDSPSSVGGEWGEARRQPLVVEPVLSSSPPVVQRPSSRGRLSMKVQLGDIQRMLQRLTHAGRR